MHATATRSLAAIFMIAASAVQLSAQSGEKLPAEDEKAIRKLVATNEAGWNNHDMQALGSIFRDDAEFINVVGMHWRGKDAIVKAHAAYHETMFKDCKLHTDDLSIRPLGPNHAIGVWVMTQDAFTTPGGSVVPKHQNRMTLVFAKDAKAGWQVVQGQNTPIDAQAAQFDPAKTK
jgi:uncharacterized protein (TIGR02246 family)